MSTLASPLHPLDPPEASPIQDDQIWDLMDALCAQTHRASVETHDTSVSLIHALSTDLDGSAFGGTSRLGSGSENGSMASWEDDVDIPNFPPLSQAMLRDDAKGCNPERSKKESRTSGEW
jgi:hypothetical protein